jgi:uncharacterized delta-60 repeat protein
MEFDPGANGNVYALALQPDGRILVGGGFTELGGQTRLRIARLNADGSLDAEFTNPRASASVMSLIVQPDGRILVGGTFTAVELRTRNYLARLNLDGTVDEAFNPSADFFVITLFVQPDGGILVGGNFTRLGGRTRMGIARLSADGMLDQDFNPGTNGYVASLAMQADGKTVLGGSFTRFGSGSFCGIARLNADGTWDPGFDMGARPDAWALAVQADGKILLGGTFTNLAGQARSRIGRLNATEPATQSLTRNGSTMTWLRGGTSPEVWRTTFEHSADGITWTNLGAGTRITGGWQVTSVSLPSGGTIRARGYVTGGMANVCGWFVEELAGALAPIRLSVDQDGSEILLRWVNGQGPYQVQQTVSLGGFTSWEDVGVPVETNSISLPVGIGTLFLRVRGQ